MSKFIAIIVRLENCPLAWEDQTRLVIEEPTFHDTKEEAQTHIDNMRKKFDEEADELLISDIFETKI